MMKFLSSFLSGIPITWYIILFLAVSLSGSLWFLQGKIEEIGGLKTAQASYVEALKSSQEQLRMRDLSCKIDDKVVSEYQAEKSEQQNKVSAVISKIDSLPRKPVANTSQDKANEIDIDSKLPDDLVRMLSESCNANKDGVCVYAR